MYTLGKFLVYTKKYIRAVHGMHYLPNPEQINSLSPNPTKRSNILKQLADHFVRLALKGLSNPFLLDLLKHINNMEFLD